MYKLTEQDYTQLYPYFLPSEIKKVFGERVPSVRTIQRYYKQKGYLECDAALDLIVKRSWSIADMALSHQEWSDYVADELAKRKSKLIADMKAKIKKHDVRLLTELTECSQ